MLPGTLHQKDSRVKEQTGTPSLLPYLEPENQCAHLSMTLFSEDPGSLENVPFPFVLLLDRDPLSSLLDAHFATDSGTPLKEVMVLIQKDNYRLPRDYPPQISNSAVEEEWRKAFIRFTADRDRHPLITLSRQISGEGTLLPFAPLFFCKTRKRFFHPPCPSCGAPLSLCRDDALLDGAGLPRYSTSMHRYLVCSSCTGTNHGGSFYAHELGNYDPPSVKDRTGLIREFSRLLPNPVESSGFPCGVCQENSACYGSEFKALSRIVPLSFYPFFLLIFESAPLKASDFLALVSGASWDDMERKLRGKGALGRLRHLANFREESEGRSSFLFREDDRFFLEALYLKLTFLAQLADRALRALAGLRESPDPVLSVEQTWIRLTGKNSHLPYFWNFELRSIDVTGRLSELPLVRHLPSGTSLYSFGMTWFHTLLVNSRQSAAEVVQAVRDTVEKGPAHSGQGQSETPRNGTSPAFHPANLLWVPMEGGIPEEWQHLWEEALGLGWTLIRSGLQHHPAKVGEDFLEKLRSLRRNIVRELFVEKPRTALPAEKPDDGAIFQVLTGIRKRWETEKAAPPEEMEDKTVVAPSPISADDTLPLDFDPSKLKEDMMETVILSSEGITETASIASAEDSPKKEHGSGTPVDVEETVVVGALRETREEELPETIILSPRREGEFGETRPAAGDTFPSPGEMNGESREEAGASEEPSGKPLASEDDLLMETVIIRPRQDKKAEDKDR